MSLSEPIEQEVVLYKDLRPETVKRYVKNDLSISKNKEAFESATKSELGRSSFSKGGGKSVIKTIYLPNEQMNTLTLENENLKRQLEQERNAYTQEVTALREELRIREEETRRRYEADQEKIRDLIEKNQKLEKENAAFAKDYFALRIKKNEVEQSLNEENEVLRLKNTAIANKFRTHLKQCESEAKVTKELVEKKSEEYTNKFRNQIRQKDENIMIIKDQYAQVQQIYVSKVKELEESLTKLAHRYQALENRRLLENEGYQTDLRNLRKRLRDVEHGKLRVSKGSRKRDERAEEEEEEEEEEDDAGTVNSEELELIKKQLNELEHKLDKSRKIRE